MESEEICILSKALKGENEACQMSRSVVLLRDLLRIYQYMIRVTDP